jgi:signal peptidase I
MDSPSFWQRLVGWGRELKSILLAVGFVLIVRTVLAEPYHVPSPSMVPPSTPMATAAIPRPST